MCFAASLESGAVVTWGGPDFGGDSSQVQEQLRNVEHIQASFVKAALQKWALPSPQRKKGHTHPRLAPSYRLSEDGGRELPPELAAENVAPPPGEAPGELRVPVPAPALPPGGGNGAGAGWNQRYKSPLRALKK